MTAKPETAAEVLAYSQFPELKEAIQTLRHDDEHGLYDMLCNVRDRLERALSAQGEVVRHLVDSPEDRFEQFVQAEIARSPEPLRELGEYLARTLDEDKFPRANALLLQLATSYTHPAPRVEVDEAMVERALSAVGPGGALVKAWLPMPNETARIIIGIAIAAALNPSQPEKP